LLTVVDDMPPGTYFVSHSYKDSGSREELIAGLPPSVEALVFPPISVLPDEFISSRLIEAILASDGLIYLDGGYSAKSFWVAFERDYALRAGKPVFCFDPVTSRLTRHKLPPLDLAVFPSYRHGDRDRVDPILEFMSKDRFFDVWLEQQRLTAGTNWVEELQGGISGVISRGGYVVSFLTYEAIMSEFVKAETLQGLEQRHLLVAFVDQGPIPVWLASYVLELVQLYGDNERSAQNRIDDLIVRLYWLIFQNTQSLEFS
jgi:hypothetical protein